MPVTIRSSSDAIKYTFPPKTGILGGFSVMDEMVSQRMNVSEKLYSHGGVIVGDGKVGTRLLKLQGIVAASDSATLEDELDLMKYNITVGDWRNSERRLYLPQYQYKRFYKLGGMAEMAAKRLSSIGADININWIIIDPFLYARNDDLLTYEKQLTIKAGSNYTQTYQSLSSTAIGGANTYPVNPYEIKVEVTSGSISSFYIRNISDSSRKVNFGHEMTAGSNNIVTMDFTNGTASGTGGIWGTGTDVIGYITDAGWWRMLPEGVNLEYYIRGSSAATVTVTIKWRPRWL